MLSALRTIFKVVNQQKYPNVENASIKGMWQRGLIVGKEVSSYVTRKKKELFWEENFHFFSSKLRI